MRLPVHVDELLRVDVRVALGRAEAGMAQQLLNGPQIRAVREQMRRERMTQRVRADAELRAAFGHVPPYEAIDTTRRQALASIIEEQWSARSTGAFYLRSALCPLPWCGSIFEPRAESVSRRAVERNEPLFTALAQHPHHSTRQVHVFHVEPDQLAQPQARRVEELQDGSIAAAERRRGIRHLEQPVHFGD